MSRVKSWFTWQIRKLRRTRFPAAAKVFVSSWKSDARVSRAHADQGNPANPLQRYFESKTEGRGVWKWTHYFDVYHRHLAKFVGREVSILEIGIYSGGSLEMWREYFGGGCKIYGVDIQDACTCYESDSVKIFVGDQADRTFWRRFRKEVPVIDVIIDDGGHQDDQQVVTLEEMLPHVSRGGVYICEDVHGTGRGLTRYAQVLADQLNAARINGDNGERSLYSPATPLQMDIKSVHFYPYITVIEKTEAPFAEFIAPRHGTQWQPFLDEPAEKASKA
jgi:hypothetical protein